METFDRILNGEPTLTVVFEELFSRPETYPDHPSIN